MEELELTYLAKELPTDLSEAPHAQMLDIYIPSSATHPTLRIRKCGETYEMTKKQPIDKNDASRQLETTVPLTQEEYRELSALPGKRVEKIRYYYPFEGVKYEIDVFQGDLTGLVLIDVEFETEEEKRSFTPPSFCGADVTQEDFIAGGMLCGKRYEDVALQLGQFGYTKIFLS